MDRFLNQIICGDCLEVMKDIPDNSIDAVVTDPPYELGFMGKKWDSTGIAYNVELWQEVLRVLKPGGHLLSFGGTRTYHRMTCAIEDAGFEIRNCIQYLYGSGFPKSMDISKAIDKKGGQELGWFIDYILKIAEERNISKKELTMLFPSKNGKPTGWLWNKQKTQGITLEQYNTIKNFLSLPFDTIEEAEREVIGRGKAGLTAGTICNFAGEKEFDITIPASSKAKQWDGWGTALKPAHEPIVVARKPLSEKTVAENVLKWGTGGINIDDCRVEFSNNDDPRIGKDYSHNAKAGLEIGEHKDNASGQEQLLHNPQGRFPANVILDEEFIPILRLRKISPEQEKVIKEFYCDYHDLSAMRKRVRDISEPNKEWSQEILRERVLSQSVINKDEGRESPVIRKETQARINSQDEKSKTGIREITSRQAQSCFQGFLDESWLQISEYKYINRRTEDNSGTNAGKRSSGNSGTSFNNGDEVRETVEEIGDSTSQKRSKERQSPRELGDARQCNAQNGTQGNNEGTSGIEEGKRGIEILACDIPKQWLKYFESTGYVARSPYCAAAMLDEQSGISKSTGGKGEKSKGALGKNVYGKYANNKLATNAGGLGDTGGASRFFYCAKASKKERGDSKHPTVKPLSLMRYLCRLITPPEGIILDPFAGSGTTLEAAILEGFNVVGIEKEHDYIPDIRRRIERAQLNTQALEMDLFLTK